VRPPYPKWAERAADYSNLFNPAFVMLVLGAACHGFEDEQQGVTEFHELGMPFPLLFLAAPLALSPEFNQARPTRLSGSLVSWSRKRAVITANMSAAAYSLVPAVREAVVYGLRAGHLKAVGNGRFREGTAHGDLEVDVRADLSGHLKNAVFAGRWLAKSGATASILEAFGLRP
jgi:hypothetical protein